MSCACTPVLVGVVSLVSEVQLPFKNVQISLLGHGLKPLKKEECRVAAIKTNTNKAV